VSEQTIIESKIKRKESEIQSLEKKIETAKVYLQALNDIQKAIENESDGDLGVPAMLRKGSAVAQAHDVILEEGKPVHIDDILTRTGKGTTREAKASLTSSLSAYVRRSEIFTRPAPNTFGLIDLGHFEVIEEKESEPPEGFGEAHPPSVGDEIPF